MKQTTCFSIGNFIKLPSFVCLFAMLFSFFICTVNGQTLTLSTPISGDPNGGTNSSGNVSNGLIVNTTSSGTGTAYYKWWNNAASGSPNSGFLSMDRLGVLGFGNSQFNRSCAGMYDAANGKLILTPTNGGNLNALVNVCVSPNAEYIYSTYISNANISGNPIWVVTSNAASTGSTITSASAYTSGPVTAGAVCSFGAGSTQSAGSAPQFVTSATTTSVTLNQSIAYTATAYNFRQPMIYRHLWTNTTATNSLGNFVGSAATLPATLTNNITSIPFLFSGDLVYMNGASTASAANRTNFFFTGNNYGMAFDPSGNMYISDRDLNSIFKISILSIAATGTSGTSSITLSSANATLTAGMLVSGLNIPVRTYIGSVSGTTVNLVNGSGTAVNLTGNISSTTGTIGFITGVQVLAGSVVESSNTISGGASGSSNGTSASTATFSRPMGLAFDFSGNLYVAEVGNTDIRKIAAVNGAVSSSSAVTTLSTGYNFSTGYAPIALDPTGTSLYVGDGGNKIIYKTPLSTGTKAAYFGSGALSVASCAATSTSAATITTASSLASITGGMYIQGSTGTISTFGVAKITGSGSVTSPFAYTTFAGTTVNATAVTSFTMNASSADASGITVGTGKFINLLSIAVDPTRGDVYFSDYSNQLTRKLANSNDFYSTASTNWATGSTWNGGSAPASGNDAYINSNVTVAASASIANVVVKYGQTLTINSGQTLTLSGNLVNNGTVINNGTIAIAGVLYNNSGTITNNGTISTSAPTTTSTTPIPSGATWGGTISYSGSSAQTMVAGTYTNLTIATTSSAVVSLAGAASVSGTLTLTSGVLALGSSNLTLTGSFSGVTAAGTAGTNYINTGTGSLLYTVASTSATTFPTGNATNYTPLVVTPSSATSTVYTVGTSSTLTAAPAVALQVVNAQWSVLASPTTTATIAYYFNTANKAASYNLASANELGTYNGTAYTVSSPFTASNIPQGSDPYSLTTSSAISIPASGTNIYVVGNTNSINGSVASTWTGAVSGSWNTAGNWSPSGVPDNTVSVIIPASPTNPLVIAASDNVSANAVTINSGATITNNNSSNAGLNIYGAFTNNGAISGIGSVILVGSAIQTVSGGTSGTPGTISNLKVNNSNGVTIASGAYQTVAALTLTSGTVTLTGNLSISTSVTRANGAFSGNPVYTTAIPVTYTSTVTTGAELTPSSGSVSDLTVNASGSTVTLGAAVSVAGVTLTAGTLADGGFTLTNTGNLGGTGTHTGSGRIKMTASSSITGAATLATLEIAPGAGNTVTVTTAPSVIGNLVLTSGTLANGGKEIKVTGNVTGTGTESGTGRITIVHVTSQSVGTTQGSASATVTLSASNSSIVVGQSVFGGSVFGGTTVSAISGTTLTLSGAPGSALTANTVLYFSTTHSIGSSSGTMTISNLATSSTGATVAAGNINISGDLVVLPPATTGGNAVQVYNDGGFTTSIGGNTFNYGTQRANLLSNATGSSATGKISLTGTATSSGLISFTAAAGTTTGFAVGDTVNLTSGATFGLPAKAVVASLSGSAVATITMVDPGSGYTVAPTGFVKQSGSGSGTGVLSSVVIATTTGIKYINLGITACFYNNIELANTVLSNTVSSGRNFNVQGNFSFSGGNTSGTFTLASNSTLFIGGNVNNTNLATAAAITMASTNAFIGGTTGAASGAIFAVSSTSVGPIYFSSSANVISSLTQNTNNTASMTIANAVVPSSIVLNAASNLIVGSGGNLTLPTSITLASTGIIDATNSNATITLAGANTFAGTTFVSATVGNLVVSDASPTLTSGLTISNTLTLRSTNTSTNTFSNAANLTIATGGSIVVNKTNTGTQVLSAIPTFAGTANYSYTGTTAITMGNEVPTATNVANNITINNTAGVTLNTSNDLTVNGTLTLTSGKLSLGNSNLFLAASTASLSGVSTSKYVVINGAGVVTWKGLSTSGKVFPIGTTSFYAPLTIANTTGTSDVSSSVGTSLFTVGNSSNVVGLKWSVIGSAATTATITYQFNGSNKNSVNLAGTFDLGVYDGSSYSTFSAGTPSGTDPYTVTVTGLSIPNSTNLNDNQYVIGNTGDVVPITVTRLTWTGAISTSWTDPGNWDYSFVPDATYDITIPGSLSRYPTITANQQSKSLTLNSGATLTINSGFSLDIDGAIVNNGTINGAGKVSLSGASTQNLSGTGTIYSLSVLNTAAVLTGANQTINTNLTLNGASIAATGTLTIPNGGTVTVTSGNITGNGLVYGSGSGVAVTYNGSGSATSAKEIAPASGVVSSLTLNGSGTYTLGSAATVQNLNLTSGTLADAGFILTVSGSISGTGTHSGSGKIKMTGSGQTISGTTFGNLEIANGSGNIITATGALYVSGVLTLTSGILNDGGYEITTGGNLAGTSGTHNGYGRLTLTNATTIAGGITVGNLYQNNPTLTSTVNGNITVTGDLRINKPSGTAFILGTNTMTVGGNIINNSTGTTTISGTSSTGKVSMTGTATQSVPISISSIFGGTNYAVGDTISVSDPTGNSRVPVKLRVSSIGSNGAISGATITDFGSGFTSSSPLTITSSNIANVYTTSGDKSGVSVTFNLANTTLKKYAAVGTSSVIYSYLELANTVANNIVAVGPTNGLYVAAANGLTFTAGNTSGKIQIGENGGNALRIGNATATTVTMGVGNSITSSSAASGTLYINTTTSNAGTIYFDQSTVGTTNSIFAITNNAGGFTIGNNVRVNTITLTNGTTNVGASATLTVTNTISTASGVINASNSGSMVELAGSVTVSASTFNPATIGNLVITDAAVTVSQAITVSNSLTLNSTTSTNYTVANGSNLTIGSNASITKNKTGSGKLALAAVPTFTSLSSNNFSYLGSVKDTIGNEMPASTNTIASLTVNRSADLLLKGFDITTSGALTLTSGYLITGNNSVTAGSVTGGNASSYVLINGVGTLKIPATSGAAKLYPVGTRLGYTPVTITPSASQTYSIGLSNNAYTVQPGDTTQVLKVQWSVLGSTSATTASVKFGFNTSLFSSAYTIAASELGNDIGAGWVIPASAGSIVPTNDSSGNTYYSLTATGLSIPFSGRNNYVIGNTGNVVVLTTTWLGTNVSNQLWSTASNWDNGVPTSNTDAVIPATTYKPVITAASSTKSLSVATNAYITNNSTLSIYGTTLAFNTNGYITGGTTTLVGSAAQSVTGNGSVLGNLTLNNNAGATIASGSNSLGITGVLTLQLGQLTTNSNLTFKSTSIANTGTLAPYGANGNTGTINGTVTVERYIPAGYRAYRDMASQLSGVGTIYNNWQEGGSFTSGKGIFITGTGALDANTANYASGQPVPNSNGLDFSINGNNSAFTYSYPTFTPLANTKVALDPFVGYRVLIRGDRSFNLATTPVINYYGYGLRMVNATVLRSIGGKLITGNVTYNTTNASGTTYDGAAITSTAAALNNTVNAFSMVANPYVAPVFWGNPATHSNDGTNVYGASSNINGSYWFLDPTLGATGFFRAYNAVTGSSVFTLGTGGNSSGTAGYQYIQPGQAVFVQTSAASPAVVFKETAKAVTSTKLSVFGVTAPLSKIYISLLKKDSAANYNMVDGAAIAFNEGFTNDAYGPQDALKFSNANDNLYITDKGKSLSIDGRLPATATDKLPIAISKVSGTNYQLVVDATNYTSNGYAPYLVDSYRGTISALTNGTNTITFIADANVAATYSNRFSLAFKPTTLAVNSIVASATLNNKIATVSWNTVGEKGVSRFEIEKSTDAKTFTKIGQTIAKNTATASYSATDNSATATTSYYRIKAISEVGTVSYSNLVQLSVNSKQFTVYPNPLVGKTLNVSLANIAAGKYTVTINNVLGQKVQEAAISHAGGNGSHAITVNSFVAAGSYSVTVRNASGEAVYQSNLVVQP